MISNGFQLIEFQACDNESRNEATSSNGVPKHVSAENYAENCHHSSPWKLYTTSLSGNLMLQKRVEKINIFKVYLIV